MNSNEKHDEKVRIIYRKAEEFLLETTPSELCGELEKYFNVEKKFNSKNEIMFQLFGSLQNKHMATNVIGFWKDDRKPIFREVLFDYHSDTILNTYKADADLLFDCFQKRFSINNAESKRNLWKMYAKSVISACNFLRIFSDANDFDKFIKCFSYNKLSSAALPMLLEKEVFGLGFALACDFLKELGYTQYPKPDVHIIEIFHAFGLCEKNDYSAYKAVIEMAHIVNQTPYKVDKIFWLIGSGNYYHDKIEIKDNKNKEKFIERIKKEYRLENSSENH